MASLTQYLTQLFQQALTELGADPAYGQAIPSNRPDLGQFQVNGALAAAKSLKRNPRELAQAILDALPHKEIFADLSIAGPGFINIRLTDEFLRLQSQAIHEDARLGLEMVTRPRRVLVDYGGYNVAKVLHVGHLRPTIIGESIRRVFVHAGDSVIGDVHLGDWGLQMGQLIEEIRLRQPDLPYFNPNHTGPYPEESPVTMDDLLTLYPQASARAKEDATFAAAARQATYDLQHNQPGYRALWQHFVNVSIADIKRHLALLETEYDFWLGESHAEPYLEDMLTRLKQDGFAYESQGALVMDVTEPEDKKEIPPLILVKRDGAVLYGTTDLATIDMRVQEFRSEFITYVVDIRQAMHFKQVFRAAHKSGIATNVELEHAGFGTINGPDGRPFKSRSGDAATLGDILQMCLDKAAERVAEIDSAGEYSPEDRANIARYVGMATIKFADLMNHRSSDYILDVDRFSAFEGKTGPYLLYSTVRAKSILRKASEAGLAPGPLVTPTTDVERDLLLQLGAWPDVFWQTYHERAPNHLCEYAYQVATAFNRFYRECHILREPDLARQAGWLGLTNLTRRMLEQVLALLNISIPERM